MEKKKNKIRNRWCRQHSIAAPKKTSIGFQPVFFFHLYLLSFSLLSFSNPLKNPLSLSFPFFITNKYITTYQTMRTSRGLRITSLIVVSPVILILISLVAILAIAIQSQVKAWYFAAVSSTLPQHQPFFSEPSTTSLQQQQFINARSISRLASTAFVFSYNHPTTQLSSSHQHIDNNSSSNRLDSPKSTIVTTTTTTRRLLPRLKRLLPSSTWIGVLAVFAFITFQKVFIFIYFCLNPGERK